MRFTATVITIALCTLSMGAAIAAATPGKLDARQLPSCGDPPLECTTDTDCANCTGIIGITFTCQNIVPDTGLGVRDQPINISCVLMGELFQVCLPGGIPI